MILLDDYIEMLAVLRAREGNLPVMTDAAYGVMYARRDAPPPRVEHVKILQGNRERVEKFWHSRDGEEARGEKVLKV